MKHLSDQELVKEYFDSQTEIAVCRVAFDLSRGDERKRITSRKHKNEAYMKAIAKELDERGKLELILT